MRIIRTSALLFCILAIAALVVFVALRASADTSATAVRGWGWSSTIGWISFNCADRDTCASSNYGMTVDASGAVSGYAWSSNIGWISANEGAGCPQGPCQPRVEGNALVGWFKALAGGTQGSGGWDGWIQLSGTTGEGGTYGVTSADGKVFEGFAWGSDVIGWVKMRISLDGSALCWDGSIPVNGKCPLKCDPPLHEHGGKCVCSDGQPPHNGSCVRKTPKCPVSRSVCGTAGLKDDQGRQEDPSFLYWRTYFPPPPAPICSPHDSFQTTCAAGCADSSCRTAAPVISIKVRPSLVRQGKTTNVIWSTQNVFLCTVTGTNGDGPWTTNGDVTDHSQISGAVPARTTYTLQCDDVAPESATVNIVPVFNEQ